MSTCPRCGKWNGAVAAPAGTEPTWCVCGYARERRETDALKERVASLEATIKRDMGGDYLSLQALYINQLGVVRGHEQDRAKVQAALGNGANEDLWQPGTSWVDAAIRAIQHYENHIQC